MAGLIPWALLLTVLSGIPVARQLRHHPKGLWLLFFTEMWERFSYYGMRSLLIFYLTQHFLLDDRVAQGRYAAYTTLNYLLPLAGGLFGDRLIGARRAVAFGALLLVAGHLTMAIETPAARQFLTIQEHRVPLVSEGFGDNRIRYFDQDQRHYRVVSGEGGALTVYAPSGVVARQLSSSEYEIATQPASPASQALFHLALALIVVGVGFQKANMTAMVGALYRDRGMERNQGFTLYMFGINIGAFWSSVLCGWLAMKFGWSAGFGAAGIGMTAGYLAFITFPRVLGDSGAPPVPDNARSRWLVYLAAVPVVVIVWHLLQSFELVGGILALSTVAIAGYIGRFMWRDSDSVERMRTALACVLVVLAMVWTAFAEQTGSVLALFSERNTNLSVGGLRVNAAQVGAFYMGFLLILVPVLAGLWDMLGRRSLDPTPITKFALAFVLQAIAFAILGMSSAFADSAHRVPLALVVIALFIHAISEMTFGPVGLAEMTRLAPARLVSTLAAVWYLAVSWGQWLGGMIARAAAAPPDDSAVSLPIYNAVFKSTAAGSLVAGLATLLLVLWLRRAGASAKLQNP